MHPGDCAVQQQKPPQGEGCALKLESWPGSPHLEKALVQKGRPREAKNKINTALLDYTSEVGCLFKSEYYEYEKEVRIIVHPKSKMLKTRESNGRSVYYLPVQFEKNIVKSITSSPTMDRNIAQNKIKNIIEQEGYNVEIKHSNVPYRNSY